MAQEALYTIKEAEKEAEKKKEKARNEAKRIHEKSQMDAKSVVDIAKTRAEETVSEAIRAARVTAQKIYDEFLNEYSEEIISLKKQIEKNREKAIKTVMSEIFGKEVIL